MPRINLLPWRAEQRRERKLAFFVALGGATIGAGVLAFGGYLMFSSLINAQAERNQFLKTEIRKLDKQIEEINNLETAKQRYIARMEIIERLQRSRPEIVHVFDTVARTLPDGTYLTALKQSNNRLRFDGVAQSSTRVSTLMRNIDSSEWLRNPELEVVETRKDNTQGASFILFAEKVSKADAPAAGADQRVAARRGNSP
jgi:type IV pilus assembly protein PilN